jgi:hypothetical protein
VTVILVEASSSGTVIVLLVRSVLVTVWTGGVMVDVNVT